MRALPPPIPPRRKGMHESTYVRLAGQMMLVQGRVLSNLAARLARTRGEHEEVAGDRESGA
jgi:hypothetical protein